MSPALEIQIIAALVSMACSLPGCFLVLTKQSMMSDSISHSILLGIVLGFFLTGDLRSPLLIFGAALAGLLTVWLTQLLSRPLANDSAMGLVFPFLFSVAVILISRFAGSVHLDTDSVLLGELAFAPFDRLIVSGVDLGAKAMYSSVLLLLINLIFILLFFSRLQLAAFDPLLAAVLGLSPAATHYALMSLLSLTAVGSFEAVGSVLVVALMVGPPVTAYFLTDSLRHMLTLSTAIAAFCGLAGSSLAFLLDVSIAGSIALTVGLLFALAFVFSHDRGLLSSMLKIRRQRLELSLCSLLMHVMARPPAVAIESAARELSWSMKRTDRSVSLLVKRGHMKRIGDMLVITDEGMESLESTVPDFSSCS